MSSCRHSLYSAVSFYAHLSMTSNGRKKQTQQSTDCNNSCACQHISVHFTHRHAWGLTLTVTAMHHGVRPRPPGLPEFCWKFLAEAHGSGLNNQIRHRSRLKHQLCATQKSGHHRASHVITRSDQRFCWSITSGTAPLWSHSGRKPPILWRNLCI